MAYLVQYHNFEHNVGGFPGHGTGKDEKLSMITHSISSRKRWLILNSNSDTIFLILGIKFTKYPKKKYFLWSKTVVNEISKNEDEGGFVNVTGKQFIMDQPVCLNKYDGFEEFLRRASNFSLGLMDITQWDFTDQLILLSEKFKCKIPENKTYGEHISSFKKYVNMNYL